MGLWVEIYRKERTSTERCDRGEARDHAIWTMFFIGMALFIGAFVALVMYGAIVSGVWVHVLLVVGVVAAIYLFFARTPRGMRIARWLDDTFC